MRHLRLAAAPIILLLTLPASALTCHFGASSAKNPATGNVDLPWRTDYPTAAPNDPKPWEAVDFRTDYKGYMNAILGMVRAAGLKIDAIARLAMDPTPQRWIGRWMDYGPFGRE